VRIRLGRDAILMAALSTHGGLSACIVCVLDVGSRWMICGMTALRSSNFDRRGTAKATLPLIGFRNLECIDTPTAGRGSS